MTSAAAVRKVTARKVTVRKVATKMISSATMSMFLLIVMTNLLMSVSVFLPGSTVPVQGMTGAVPAAETVHNQSKSRRIARPRPPRRTPPNRVQPGGGLDVAARACMSEDDLALTALVPVENPVYTVQASPTFLFYFPDAPESIAYAEFIVLSEDEKEEIYSTQFLPVKSGIVSVSMPLEAGQTLAVGEAYHWYLNLHCETTAAVPSVNGWVERIAAEEAAELAIDESGLPTVWYDAIAQAAQTIVDEQQLASSVETDSTSREESLEYPTEQAWVQLLTAADLIELIDVPVIGPVSVEP